MLRKLFIVAALVLGTAAATSAPAPAIDFVCSCQVCAGGSNLGCRDTSTGRLTSCSLWWSTHSSHC